MKNKPILTKFQGVININRSKVIFEELIDFGINFFPCLRVALRQKLNRLAA